MNSQLDSQEQRWRIEKREFKGDLEKAHRRLRELEEAVADAKQTQTRVMLGTGTKDVAVKEVTQQNMILSDCIEKMKNELFNIRRNIS